MDNQKGAAGRQPECPVAQPDSETLTPAEQMLISFYRLLDEGEQGFMRRAIEAMARRERRS